MKIQAIQSENFGVFADRRFDFGDRLQIIYGPNEAGKSTLLQLIREAIFGFKVRNPYAFGDSGKMAVEVGASLADDRELQFRRTKSTKSALTGQFVGSDETFDEATWINLLGGMEQSAYEQLFGFSLTELASGEAGLKAASLDEALYGGSLGGLGQLQTLKKTLETEGNALFLPSGRKPRINELLGQIKDARQRLRNAPLRPAQYDEKLREIDQLVEKRDQLYQQHEEAFRRQRHLDRIEKAYPVWREILVLNEQIASLSGEKQPPREAIEKFGEQRTRLQSLEEELSRYRSQLELLAKEQAESAAAISEDLLRQEDTIHRLVQTVGEIRSFRNHIPLRQQEQMAALADADRAMRELHPEWSVATLSQFALSHPQRKEVEQAAATESDLRSQLKVKEDDLQRLQQKCERAEERLAELPAVSEIDFAPLLRESTAWNRRAEREGDLRRDLQQLTQSAKPLKSSAAALADYEKVSVTQLPSDGEIERFGDALQQGERKRQEAADRLASEEETLAERQAEIELLDQRHALVPREQLQQARQERDAAWNELRNSLGSVAPDAEKIAEFEQLLKKPDELADRRQEQAELLARRDKLTDDLDLTLRRMERCREAAQAAETQLESLRKEWLALWSPLQVVPLSPKEMLTWCDKFRRWREVQDRIADVETSLAEMSVANQVFLQQLGEALPEAKDLNDIAAAVDNLQKAAAGAAKLRDEHAQAAAEAKKLAADRDAAIDLTQQLKQRQLAAMETIRTLLAAAPDLGSSDAQIIIDLLSRIDAVRGMRDSAASLQTRVSDMQQGIAAFEQEVATCWTAAGFPASDLSAESQAIELDRRLKDVVAASHQKANAEKQLSRLQQQIAECEAQQGTIQTQLAAWREASGVADDAGLEEATHKARELADLETERRTLQAQLTGIRQSEDAAAFEAALAAADLDQVQLALQESEAEAVSLQKQLDEVKESLGRTRQQQESLEGSDKSIAIASELESLKGELQEKVDQYAPLVLARAMIDRAVAKHRAKTQGDMLEAVGRIFREMTAGQYLGIERQLDENGTLIVIPREGKPKTAEELSTGTREQLYLSIRLAYIESYATSSEPLPVVMDDILVNFDDERQRRTLAVLSDFDPRVQILFLTCHQTVVEKAHGISASIPVLSLNDMPIETSSPAPKSRKRSKSQTPTLFN
ncbi:AAA family ATPase [Blastopirellula sp. JC732]|uniref:AAA family ATPase n=1 Tax=Blastopirellula sediminis TaxID=2894196 RepID=A0A9X1MJV0_9BACT|nr:AAA family ATPase [Blastopirellula sediminis]MCC9609352.1 AAA family ATPase [Blastopirellula sediminis]MCC9627871.1 AAA family ATPase [Blastopirellula sediminis]